jgi:hypothetical protein
MKTLRVSDHAHRELTRWLGQMMAQSGKPRTFSGVIEALVSRFECTSIRLVADFRTREMFDKAYILFSK